MASSAMTPGSRLRISQRYLISNGRLPPRVGTVLNVRQAKQGGAEAYITFQGQDKRLDSWVKEADIGEPYTGAAEPAQPEAGPSSPTTRKRLGGGKEVMTPVRSPGRLHAKAAAAAAASPAVPETPNSAASTPEREHATMTRVRNFEDVRVGEYLIKTWYYSPYPMTSDEPQSVANGSVSTPSRLINGGRGGSNGSSSKKRKLDHPVESSANGAGGAVKGDRKYANSRSVNELFATGIGQGGEGARGRLWVCDLCFKYMRSRAAWDKHSSSCDRLQPPGRRVYQKGSYSIYEIDGAEETLYCQNLSLFGKLFIDHKSVFFHVENFLFYVLCDAATSRRDGVMAFFSKEKLSYDDYNLACIVTFPPHQGRGFGKLLIEFSYYLTKHPSTRPASHSPGTPERPLSDLGLKGYTAYWMAVVLRLLRELLAEADPLATAAPRTPSKSDGRSLRRKPATLGDPVGEPVKLNGAAFLKRSIPGQKGQYAISTTLAELSRACHLKQEDVTSTLAELGMLRNRRAVLHRQAARRGTHGEAPSQDDMDTASSAGLDGLGDTGSGGEYQHDSAAEDLGEWQDVEIVISRAQVDAMWAKWKIKDRPVLEESCVLL